MNFILGVGAQRCGTTWLADYLVDHPQVFMTPHKELHVFDAMFAPELSGYSREKRFGELRFWLDKLLAGKSCSVNDLALAIEKYELSLSENAYLSYFQKYVREEHKAIGEITPSYSLIPQRGFLFIRNFLLKAGLTPKVIFIMRDPVERLFSQLRFNQRRGVASVKDAYGSALSSPRITMRTRYDQTITNLRNEFKEDELLFLFYEELFSDQSIKTVCQFLGIDFRPADFSRHVNASPDVGRIDPTFERAARNHLNVVYDFCADQFGQLRIRDLWKCY